MIVFFEGLVLWAVFPVTSFYCEQLGGGPAWVGVMFALLSAPKVISNPIFGRLADRFGRRPLLAVASLGTLSGSVGWALAPTIGWLAVSRMIAGLFSAQSALCQTVVADVTLPQRRAAGMGVVGAAFGLSMVLGPLVGAVTTRLGSHAAVGWVCAGIQTLSFLTVVFLLPETRPARVPAAFLAGAVPDGRPSGPTGVLPCAPVVRPPRWQNLLRARYVAPLLLVTLLTSLTVAQLTSTLSVFAKDAYRFNETEASYAFAFFGLIGVVVQGGLIRPLVPRLGEHRTAVFGIALLALAFGILAARPPAWAFWTSLVLLAVGTAFNMPTVTALLSGCVDEQRQGELLGVQQSVTSLGRGGGSGLAGWLYQHYGPSWSYALALGLSVLAALLLIPQKVRVPHHAGAAPAAAVE